MCSTGNAADCTVTEPTNTWGTDVFLIAANYVAIEDLTVVGGDWGVLQTNGYNHIVVKNVIASSAACEGIASVGSDYIDFEENVVTQSAKVASNSCSGITVYEPIASDSKAGTHIYFGYNITYANGNPVGGTDGEGMSFDDFSHSQHAYGSTPYTQAAVAEENISYGNHGPGFTVGYTGTGGSIIIRNNTFFKNNSELLNLGITTRSELTCVDCKAIMVNNILWADRTQYSSDASDTFNCDGTCLSGYVQSNNLLVMTTSGGIANNPLFTSTPTCSNTGCSGTPDWHLGTGSPAIGIGTSSHGLPPTDLDGGGFDSPPDAGAYQNKSEPTPTPTPTRSPFFF